MLALAFTCTALLVLCGSIHSDRSAPLLITENMWPRGCVLDCQRGRHRAVCGSNGRLYKSMCAFQRAQCINTHLRLAPRAHCSDRTQSKCQLARVQALEANTRGSSSSSSSSSSSLVSHVSHVSHVSAAAAMFVPECHPDGHFLPVQCHNQTGYCWCSTPDGKPLSGTSVLHLIPSCSDEADGPGPTLDPRKPAELTAPPIWVTILMNSVRRPTDSPQTCERERAALLSQMLSAWQEERFIPECTADGRYSAVQCHTATGYCWCVRVESGRPLSGTSARNRIPDCTGAEEAPDRTDRRFRDKPLPGCPGARKEQFLQSLITALQLEAKHAGSLSPDQAANTPPSSAPSLLSNPPSSTTPSSSSSFSSSSPLNVAPAAAPEAADSSGPEEVLQWHFTRLDVDSSGVLSEREARPLRQFLRRRLKPRRCAKKFVQYCDRDGDRGLTLEELRVCLVL
ncbi:SPARC-related modular calcium-binding protein 1-like isoform X2 [Hippoglossus hippoglossus]|uniref:SPARC-related modular calcium-binding protein 1-like isoform X2 n=1 Tax=Hippoglossus hippoglossus TaxID=8267 RepID=UPI00148D0913|nr:SPARC-related modular calcium-binding protein 1-like isoform X2 [Hippoglossus hippoglossus]